MGIEDDIRREFMQTFHETAVERLGVCRTRMEETLALETRPRVEMVRARAEVLRELHAFKGEARMMGAEDVGGATEVAEYFLKQRHVPLDEVSVRLLGRTFEAIEKLVAFHAGRLERSPLVELNALLRLLSRPVDDDPAATGDDVSAKTARLAPVASPSAAASGSSSGSSRRHTSTDPHATGLTPEQRRRFPVLLLDDSDIVRTMAVQALRAAGYPADAVATLAELHAHVRQRRPAAVLVDFQLGDITGADVCRELRSDATTAGLAVVLFSGMEAEELEQTASELGAVGFLPKPENWDEWIRRLDALTDRFEPFA